MALRCFGRLGAGAPAGDRFPCPCVARAAVLGSKGINVVEVNAEGSAEGRAALDRRST